MSLLSQIAWDDTVLPFQLDRPDIRGRVARLDGVLEKVLAQHSYPTAIEALVSEAALLTALIGQTIKLRWKLSLQIRGNGPVRIIATDYYGPAEEGASAQIRGWASYDAERLDNGADPFAQIGEGYFAILIDQGAGMTPYQGITPLSGGSLASCAQTYFAQSEQLPTRFALAFGRSVLPGQGERWRGGGVMLQHMPKASPFVAGGGGSGAGGLLESADILDGEDGENWSRANILLDTVDDLELIGPTVQPTDLLVRLFHEESPRVFDAQRVEFGCTCSDEKVRTSLGIYSAKDIATMTTPEGTVTADCQFCGAHYVFDPLSLGFEAMVAPDGSPLPSSAAGDATEAAQTPAHGGGNAAETEAPEKGVAASAAPEAGVRDAQDMGQRGPRETGAPEAGTRGTEMPGTEAPDGDADDAPAPGETPVGRRAKGGRGGA